MGLPFCSWVACGFFGWSFSGWRSLFSRSGFTARKELVDHRIVGMSEEVPGVALSAHSVGFGIQEDGIIADGEDARQVMGDDHKGRAQTVPQAQDEFIELARGERVQAG